MMLSGISVTQITAHTGGGLPLTTIDRNGTTTTLTSAFTYDRASRPLEILV